MSTVTSKLDSLFKILSNTASTLEDAFYKIPGSSVVARYVKSSHQNDPGRTLLEIILIIFTIRTLLQSRTRADRNGRHFIDFNEKEIDELVDEWNPEPLVQPLDTWDEADLAAVPVVVGSNGPKPKLSTGKTVVNLASFNFTGLSGNEHIKQRAIETLRNYGLGACGPPGFYGTLDVHMELERHIAEFLGTEAAILYSQGFSTICSVIPAFCKRGDIIVADRGVNFAIHKGIQISRSTVRWFDHNDLKSLEDVLESVEKESRKRKAPLSRRFLITEGIFEKDGMMVDLPRLIEIKCKYKYRLILDEGISFGTVGPTGRGLTEFYNVPAEKVDLLVGSIANTLCSSGGFCAGSRVVVDHQRINGSSFVFSAAMPALLAVSASEGLNILRNSPSVFGTLHDNIRAARSILDKLDYITVPSHPASPTIHICFRSSSPEPEPEPLPSAPSKLSNPTSINTRNPEKFDCVGEERLLQEVVDECLAHSVMVTRAKRLRGQEPIEAKPSIRLAITSALTRKEIEKAVGVLKAALAKVLAKKR